MTEREIQMKRYCAVGFGVVMFLQACAALPSPTESAPTESTPTLATTPAWPPTPRRERPRSDRECRIQHYTASTSFTTTESGAVLWTVTFDAATAKLLENENTSEVDCLINEEISGRCPYWMHDVADKDIATYLPDNSLQSHGFCESS